MSTLAAVLQARILAGALAGGTSSPVSVVVDAAVVDREALTARVLAGTEAVVESLAIDSSATSSVASVVITGELLDFRVHLVVPGTTQGTWSSQCTCTHAELVTHVRHHLARALEARAPELAVALASPPIEPPEPAPSVEPTRPAVAPAPQRRGLGAAGRAGAVLAGLGGLGVGGGAVALAVTHRFYDETFQSSADLRAGSIAVVAVGSTMLASGAVLLLLDRRRRKARMESHR